MGASARPRLGVVGSCNVDLVVAVAHLPRPGETLLGGDVERLPGGKGANQAVAAAVLGASVTIFAAVGDDEAGRWLTTGLGARGVDTSRVTTSARPTGTALITVAPDGENQIVVSPGANADVDLGDTDLDGFDAVLAQLEGGAGLAAAVAARTSRLVLNAAPATALDDAVLDACAIVIVNEGEAAQIDIARLAHCVVTRGERGAVHLARGREVARSSPPRVDAVDTVGAGDAFCAAYALRWAEGADPQSALDFAVVAGALATRARGAQGSLADRAEVERWLA